MKTPPEFQDTATFGEILGPAMQITDQEEADAYFEAMVRHGMQQDPSLGQDLAEANLRQSLAYFAGYYEHETRVRVERLFGCVHPIFGPATLGEPAPAAALSAGMQMSEALQEGKPLEDAIVSARDVIENWPRDEFKNGYFRCLPGPGDD